MKFERIMPKFEMEKIGAITYGPSHKLMATVVHYRNTVNQLRWYGDIRMYGYSAKKSNFYASKKGITFTQEICLKLNNTLVKYPDEMPIIKTGDQIITEKFQRYPNLWVAIGLVNTDNTTRIDIREWIKTERTGYEGYTSKGIRIPYESRFELSNMLMTMYNKMYDLEQEQKLKSLDKS
jgi:hypothetical protein